MADDKLIETDEDELIAVETPPKDEGKTEPKTEAEAEAEEDDEEDDKDEGDARLAESQDDNEDDISPNRRRRLKRREIRKRAKDHAERELHFLREQNNELMRRVSAVEGHALSTNAQTLDQRMQEALRDAQQAETIMARAVEAGNGDDMATALRLRDEANRRAWELSQSKQKVEQVRQQVANPGPDPRVRSLAQEWLAANPWYDASGRDEDSRITKAIDDGLVAQGYDPKTPDYWHELTRRVSTRLNGAPAEQEADAPEPAAARRKAPPTGNTREHAPVSTRKEVYVTPERKQAMIDAGVWDEPALRTRYLKAYQAYDKTSAR
jgi:hypothetical protein